MIANKFQYYKQQIYECATNEDFEIIARDYSQLCKYAWNLIKLDICKEGHWCACKKGVEHHKLWKRSRCMPKRT